MEVFNNFLSDWIGYLKLSNKKKGISLIVENEDSFNNDALEFWCDFGRYFGVNVQLLNGNETISIQIVPLDRAVAFKFLNVEGNILNVKLVDLLRMVVVEKSVEVTDQDYTIGLLMSGSGFDGERIECLKPTKATLLSHPIITKIVLDEHTNRLSVSQSIIKFLVLGKLASVWEDFYDDIAEEEKRFAGNLVNSMECGDELVPTVKKIRKYDRISTDGIKLQEGVVVGENWHVDMNIYTKGADDDKLKDRPYSILRFEFMELQMTRGRDLVLYPCVVLTQLPLTRQNRLKNRLVEVYADMGQGLKLAARYNQYFDMEHSLMDLLFSNMNDFHLFYGRDHYENFAFYDWLKGYRKYSRHFNECPTYCFGSINLDKSSDPDLNLYMRLSLSPVKFVSRDVMKEVLYGLDNIGILDNWFRKNGLLGSGIIRCGHNDGSDFVKFDSHSQILTLPCGMKVCAKNPALGRHECIYAINSKARIFSDHTRKLFEHNRLGIRVRDIDIDMLRMEQNSKLSALVGYNVDKVNFYEGFELVAEKKKYRIMVKIDNSRSLKLEFKDMKQNYWDFLTYFPGQIVDQSGLLLLGGDIESNPGPSRDNLRFEILLWIAVYERAFKNMFIFNEKELQRDSIKKRVNRNIFSGNTERAQYEYNEIKRKNEILKQFVNSLPLISSKGISETDAYARVVSNSGVRDHDQIESYAELEGGLDVFFGRVIKSTPRKDEPLIWHDDDNAPSYNEFHVWDYYVRKSAVNMIMFCNIEDEMHHRLAITSVKNINFGCLLQFLKYNSDPQFHVFLERLTRKQAFSNYMAIFIIMRHWLYSSGDYLFTWEDLLFLETTLWENWCSDIKSREVGFANYEFWPGMYV